MPVTATVNARRFVFTPFSAAQMRVIAKAARDAEVARIRSGRNTSGAPARSLSEPYAKRKAKRGGATIRDLVLSGATLEAVQVKRSGKTGFTLGPTNPLARVILQVANKFELVWGKSNEGATALSGAVKTAQQDTTFIRLRAL